MERIELLAPAKDLETGRAAVNCGADAVYIGAAQFGAREAAGNSLQAVAGLIHYAHRYWARVYVTVNTLLHDDELSQAVALIHRLYELGADAIIIQDVGLLECDLPPIALFASTQMHNHTAERIAFLEQVGIRRVILARELSLEQIRQVRAQTTLELETFIHGALCVSYSGQCYLSYALGGRSGNRGQCAQPCRRSYRLVDHNGQVVQDSRYWLSLRDLNLSGRLGELIEAGVCSFKIEGRLKDQSYVMNVVGHYRQELDALLAGSGRRPAASGRVIFDFTPDLAKTFNRAYTPYFLDGRGAEIASPDTPKATGELIGELAALHSDSFTLAAEASVHPGDGLCFFDRQRRLRGAAVQRVEGQRVFIDNLEGLYPGARVYRNHDHVFINALEKSRTERKIGVRLRLEAAPGGLRLLAQDEDGNLAARFLAGPFPLAEKPAQARLNLEKQLGKLGGTDFECQGVEIDLPGMIFVPVSQLNEWRRSVLDELIAQREASRTRLSGGVIRSDYPFPVKELDFTANVLNRQAEAFYRRHGAVVREPAAESGLDLRGRKVMTTRYCLKYQLGTCPKQAGSASPGYDHLYLVDERNRCFQLRFNCQQCVMEVWDIIHPKGDAI